MATPPTFVADYEGSLGWASTTTPKTSASFNGSTGDVLVALNAIADNAGGGDTTTTSSPVETWTERTVTGGVDGFDVWAQPATTILTAARTGMTVSAARVTGNATVPFQIDVAHFTGSAGFGAVAASTGAGVATPSLSITTQFDNSAIVYLVADWAATDGTSRTHRTVNGLTPTSGNGQEFTYYRDTTNWMVVAAYISDAGAAGAKAVGLSAPATGDCEVVAVEVRGSTAVFTPPVGIRSPYRTALVRASSY